MENFVEILNYLNIPQILVIILAMWFFYNRLDNKISAVETRLEKKIEDTHKKIDVSRTELENKLESRYEALNNRIDNLYQLIVSFYKKDAA